MGVYYIVSTEQLGCYLVNENMEISHLIAGKNHEDHVFTGDWILKGFHKLLPFGKIGPRLSPAGALNEPMKFHNGRGAYVLEDVYHGTTRIWSDRVTGFWNTQK